MQCQYSTKSSESQMYTYAHILEEQFCLCVAVGAASFCLSRCLLISPLATGIAEHLPVVYQAAALQSTSLQPPY